MPDKLAPKLLSAADELDGMPRSDIQVLLRRAALRLQNRTQQAGSIVLEQDTAAVLDEFAAATGISRDEAVNLALRDWAVGMGMMDPKTT